MTITTTPIRPVARLVRKLLLTILFLFVAALVVAWIWSQPFMLRTRILLELSRMSPPASLTVPVQGVKPAQIADTFGAPRGSDRTHAGVDIFAARGTPVLSATRGLVVSIRDTGRGGKQVWVLGPARERHYYAHLDAWKPGLEEGDIVMRGDALGYLGTTGNASGTPPHLHYGIYGTQGAYDPLPLMQSGRSSAQP